MTSIAYHIEKELSEKEGCLVISILMDSKKRPLAANQLLSLATTPSEKELIKELMQEELHFQQTHQRGLKELQHSYETIHLPYSKSHKHLQKLAGTGKLFFLQKQLVCDFFGKNECYFQLKEHSPSKLAVSMHIKNQKQDFNILECDFICCGPPHWYIKAPFLKFITTDVLWKHIKLALQEWTIESIQQTKFIEEVTDPNDPTAPKVIASVENKSPTYSPKPILKLKDRMGAFADLWMDYGGNHQIAFHDHTKDVKDSNGRPLFTRNFDEEKNWENDLLETGFIKKFVENTHYFCPLDQVAKSLSFLLEIGWKLIDFKGNQLVQLNKVDLEIIDDSKGYLVKGKVVFEEHEVNLRDVMGAFNKKERFIQLNHGKIGLLPEKWEQTSLESLAFDGEIVSSGILLKKNQLGTLSSLFQHPTLVTDASIEEIKHRLLHFTGITHRTPGEQFTATLRPYQQEGLDWLCFLHDMGFHGLLADDMGLGKTVQVLAFLSQLQTRNPTLIILPSSLLFNWQREIERFLPNSQCIIHQGPNRPKDKDQLGKSEFILTSYTTLRIDLPLFSSIAFQCVILDEAQMIKNADTQIAKAVCSLNAHFRLTITGTPLENHLGELWSQFQFLMPGFLGTQSEFQAEINASHSDQRYFHRLKQKILPFMLRRSKDEVAKDLPERIDQTVWIDLHEDQRKIYDDYLSGVKGGLLKKIEIDGVAQHRIEILEAILRLRQICCHPLLISSALNEESELTSSKMDALLIDLETLIAEGRKALVYSQFTSMLALMAKAFKERGWSFVTLDGTTKNREKVVNQFQEDPNISIFLISLKAGGVGLNLTSADYVYLVEPWWNEAVENQAIDRVHRIGRKGSVVAKRLVAKETIEERMMKLKESKRDLVENLLEGNGNKSQLSSQDILELFN